MQRLQMAPGMFASTYFAEALLFTLLSFIALRCILASVRFWDDSLASADFMSPHREPINVKLNTQALNRKPKRNAAAGEGRPSQKSDLAGARGVIVRKPVRTKHEIYALLTTPLNHSSSY